MIKVDSEITDTIRTLRRSDVGCHLATDQERHKARCMSEVLGYSNLFDKEFYSCHIGLMKPDDAYFRTILNNIKLPPNQVLFVDDLQVNVDSAREGGPPMQPRSVLRPGGMNFTEYWESTAYTSPNHHGEVCL
ncbi:hypothetical protein NKDENANG_00212 [Candidatus Entotheonellaceae bacterium PAL068K]